MRKLAGGFGENVGLFSSTHVGSDGLPIIAYYDEVNANLNVIHCLDVACVAVDDVVVDGLGGSCV